VTSRATDAPFLRHSKSSHAPAMHSTEEVTTDAIESFQMNVLIDEIVRKANGVFLWVYLVVNMFLDGRRGGDTTADL
jgi:hypothetical protein